MRQVTDNLRRHRSATDVTNGPGGQIMIGYKIDPYWDVALAGDVQGLLSHLTKFQNGTLSVDTNHQHFDLELGYSRGWFTLSSASDDRKVKINVEVNKDKVKEDEERAKEKIQNLGSQIKEEAGKIRKKQ